MSNLLRFLLVPASILFICQIVSANEVEPSGCLQNDSIGVGETKRSLGCAPGKSLQLRSGVFNFSRLRQSSLPVQYWEGSSVMVVEVTSERLRIVTDICTQQIVWKRSYRSKRFETVAFEIKNPNLDPEISESFRLSPMTETEAKSALNQTMQNCRQVDSSD